MIELQHVSAGYGKVPVFSDVSCSFEPGTVTVILGINGAGKSTLLKAAAGLVPVMQGTVLLDGMALPSLSARNIARKVCVVRQQNPVPEMTVGQLVLHGRFCWMGWPRSYAQTDHQKAQKALQAMGIENLAGWRMDSLSGGQQQKAWLAQALCQDGETFFFDEPATYMDAPSSRVLFGMMERLKEQGKAVVAVLHDLCQALALGDRFLVLDQGKPAFYGTRADLLRKDILVTVFGAKVRQVCADGRSWFVLDDSGADRA